MAKRKPKLKVSRKQRFDQLIDQEQQGPQMSQQRGEGFNDLGREDARIIREANQQFPRLIEKPSASTNEELMRQVQQTQQGAARSPQRTRTSVPSPDSPNAPAHMKNWKREGLSSTEQQDFRQILKEGLAKTELPEKYSELPDGYAKAKFMVMRAKAELTDKQFIKLREMLIAKFPEKAAQDNLRSYKFTPKEGILNHRDSEGKSIFGDDQFEELVERSKAQEAADRQARTKLQADRNRTFDVENPTGARWETETVGETTDRAIRSIERPSRPGRNYRPQYVFNYKKGRNELRWIPTYDDASLLEAFDPSGSGERARIKAARPANQRRQLAELISNNGTINFKLPELPQVDAGEFLRSNTKPFIKNAGVMAADIAADVAIDKIPNKPTREVTRGVKDLAAVYAAPILSLLSLSGDTPNKEVQLNATDTLIQVDSDTVIIRSKSPTYSEQYPLDPRHWRYSVGSGDAVETTLSLEAANQLIQDRENNYAPIRTGSVVPAGYEYDEANRASVAEMDAERARQKEFDNSPVSASEAPPAPVLPSPEAIYAREQPPRPEAVTRGGSVHLDFSSRQPIATPITNDNSSNRYSAPSSVPEPQVTEQLTGANDPRNKEYIRRRDALGDSPTQEQMDELKDFGLSQHRQNFPQLTR